MTSKNLNITTKANIYKCYILPVVTYGMECVSWTDKLLQKMEVFQNHIMRFILDKRLSERMSCNTMRSITNITSLEDTIKERTPRFHGKVKDFEKGVSKICFEGIVEGQRIRGRPKRRWRDNIKTWIDESS